MKRTHLNPSQLPDWSHFFSQLVCVSKQGIRHVFISGQVGVDSRKQLTGDGGFQAQTEQAFDNVGIALSAAGADWQDVVRLSIYVVDYDEETHAAAIGQTIRSRFSDGQLPTCSLIGVQALAETRFDIEVEATAVTDEHEPASP